MPFTRGCTSTSLDPSVCATASTLIGTDVGCTEITLTGIGGMAGGGAATSGFLLQAVTKQTITKPIVINLTLIKNLSKA